MTIHDPTIEISCDGQECFQYFVVNLPINYPNLSGDQPFASLEDDEINEELKRQSQGDWTVGEDGDIHYCPDCAGDER